MASPPSSADHPDPTSGGRLHDPADLLEGLRPLPPASLRDRLDLLRGRLPASPARALAAVVGAVLVAAVAWWLLRPPAAPLESSLPLAQAAASAPVTTVAGAGGPAPVGAAGSSTTTTPVELVVQASGAVAEPGVHHLPAGARVDDLVRAAGGLTADADADRVNLAAPLTDGERVWVPRAGEQEPPEVVAGAGGGSAPAAGGAGSAAGSGAEAPPEVVDLNTATAEELETLPGVGPATAAAILAHRDENGPFGSVDELLDVRGIGDAKLEQLRPLVRV